MNGEIYLTVQEAAKIASMADETIRRAIRKGYLHATAPAAGPGRGKFRITRSELDRWIRGEPDTTEYLLKSPANAARLMEAFNDWRRSPVSASPNPCGSDSAAAGPGE